MKDEMLLILGAGSSIPFGFPSGSDLKLQILEELHPTRIPKAMPGRETNELSLAQCLLMAGFNRGIIESFQREFKASILNSIDRFLGFRLEYESIGKFCIAYLILKAERMHKIAFETRVPQKDKSWDGDWIGVFMNEANNKRPLWGPNVSPKIVTFNYDRVFEYYWYHQTKAIWPKNNHETVKKLFNDTLPLVHVHGKVGSIFNEYDNTINYGLDLTINRIKLAAAEVRVIPFDRDIENNPELSQVHNWVHNSGQVLFLGFGFDERNLEILGFESDKVRSEKIKAYASRHRLPISALRRAESTLSKYNQYLIWADDSHDSKSALLNYWVD